MNKPTAPPDAVLIRLVREADGLSTQDVARKAGISAVRLTQIENGYETRNGLRRDVRAKASTMAHIASALGIPPERLETEGQRADAAPILREILRSEEEARATEAEEIPAEVELAPVSPDPAALAAANAVGSLLSPIEQEVWAEIRRARMRDPNPSGAVVFPRNAREQRLWDLDLIPERKRAHTIAFLRLMDAEEAEENAAQEDQPGRPRHAK